MTVEYQEELAVALDAVGAATRLCAGVQADLEKVAAVTKADRSPVTFADYGSQAVMALLLARAFGDDALVGEEETDQLRQQPDLLEQVRRLAGSVAGPLSAADLLAAIDLAGADPQKADRFWVMDPIDGTKGFLRGEQFAVALALVEQNEVVLGVLGCPNYPIASQTRPGGLFYAVKSGGAFVRPSDGGQAIPLTAGKGKNLSDSRFCESVEAAHAAHETHREIAAILGMTAAPYRMDSQAKYAAIAGGDADVYLRLPRDSAYREKIWDHAAGSILVTEAGGRVTDFDGRPLDFSAGRFLGNSQGLLACNAPIHAPLLAAIRKAV